MRLLRGVHLDRQAGEDKIRGELGCESGVAHECKLMFGKQKRNLSRNSFFVFLFVFFMGVVYKMSFFLFSFRAELMDGDILCRLTDCDTGTNSKSVLQRV